jgi:hypothetical protein
VARLDRTRPADAAALLAWVASLGADGAGDAEVRLRLKGAVPEYRPVATAGGPAG